MEEVLKFLQENKVFYLATLDGNQPRVRPMGFVMIYEGRLCFCTNNKKEMFKQMKACPRIEICACAPDGRYLRVSGSTAFNPARAAKEKALEINPHLKTMYSADDGIFEIFHFEEATAVFADMQGNRREVRI
ncbi:MAG: pyridoxamine 5'-phosphate oxidase family protein [Treponema sp.]|jgi:uncharacterized pyridoxamine 5'-phosphate oxidase family protein|nr:pyridoxamine 5'-phosphate oxidase family protein [Treponema sp.]